MILVSDSATPSAIVNQSACTGPFPIIQRVPEYERFMFRVSHACGIASHCVVSRAPVHTERETMDVTRANYAPILKEPISRRITSYYIYTYRFDAKPMSRGRSLVSFFSRGRTNINILSVTYEKQLVCKYADVNIKREAPAVSGPTCNPRW